MPTATAATLLVALAFMVLLALINLRGVGESVKFNVVLTLVEISGAGHRHRHRLLRDGHRATATSAGWWSSTPPSDKGMFLAVTAATAIAFFAMVGFEDSVNMVEETKDPERIFPQDDAHRPRHRGASSTCWSRSPWWRWSRSGDIQTVDGESRLLTRGRRARAPRASRSTRSSRSSRVFAVANTALINMLMASRLLYGMASQDVLPRALGKVLPGRRTPWVGDRLHHRCWRSG